MSEQDTKCEDYLTRDGKAPRYTAASEGHAIIEEISCDDTD
jgi:hypothetical protein